MAAATNNAVDATAAAAAATATSTIAITATVDCVSSTHAYMSVLAYALVREYFLTSVRLFTTDNNAAFRESSLHLSHTHTHTHTLTPE